MIQKIDFFVRRISDSPVTISRDAHIWNVTLLGAPGKGLVRHGIERPSLASTFELPAVINPPNYVRRTTQADEGPDCFVSGFCHLRLHGAQVAELVVAEIIHGVSTPRCPFPPKRMGVCTHCRAWLLW